MVLTPALDLEEPGDFSFSAAPLSPSSPTPLPSTAWKPFTQRGPSSSEAERSSDSGARSPLGGQTEEATVSGQEPPSADQLGTARSVTGGQSIAQAAEAANDGKKELAFDTQARTVQEAERSSSGGTLETGSVGQKAIGRDGSPGTIPAVSKEEAAGSTFPGAPSHSNSQVGSTQATDTKSAPVMKAPPPRKKVPFEKGYSQMDWLKLTQTHPDLAGLRGGPRRRIKMEEIRQHKSEDDSWTVLRGKVFNITPYFNFHPGGNKMLKLAAGKDSTDLFNKYHMWVNADFLLEKCWLGILDSD